MDEIKLKITDMQRHFKTAPQIENVQRYSDEQKTRISKAAKDFESLMTSMMLKSMNETNNGFFGEDSYGGDYFNSIFENEIAQKMSQGKGIGIADILYRKITGEELNKIQDENFSPKLPAVKINLKNIDRHMNPIVPSSRSVERLNRFDDLIEQASAKYGVDKNIIKSVILTESAGNEKALSSAKAKGLMQLMDSTAKDMGVNNVWNPKENIFGGTKYLSQMLQQYNGDVKLALASYNAGPGNVDKYNGVPPFEETQNYVVRVMGYLKHFESI